MTLPRTALILTAVAGSLALAACETDNTGPASARAERRAVSENRACRPGDTEAGTRSGLQCDAGSSTGTPTGNDANVKGAASGGSAPAVPSE